MLYFVFGFFPMKVLFTFKYFIFSSLLIWLAKLPSVTSKSSFNRLKSTASLTIKMLITPKRTRWSKSLLMLSSSPKVQCSVCSPSTKAQGKCFKISKGKFQISNRQSQILPTLKLRQAGVNELCNVNLQPVSFHYSVFSVQFVII